MLDDLLLGQNTRQQLKAFMASPSHSLLITGEEGAGKTTVALELAALLLSASSLRKLVTLPAFKQIIPSPSISIDEIRELKHFLQLKTLGKQKIRRTVLVEDAQTMTLEAQNAFLKLLEEPPADTVILLTCDNAHALLPTIASRAPEIKVTPVLQTDAKRYFSGKFSEQEIARAYLLSEGNVGLLYSLLDENLSHPLAEAITTAKELIAKTTFARLIKIEDLVKEKQQLPYILMGYYKVLHAALTQAAQKNQTGEMFRLKEALKIVRQAQAGLAKNASTKLLLTHLFINV